MSVQTITKLKTIKLAIANAFHTRKSLFMPEGSIASRHTHTPTAQWILISSEERLFIILRIRGIFQSGKTIEATKAILSIIANYALPALPSTCSFLCLYILIYSSLAGPRYFRGSNSFGELTNTSLIFAVTTRRPSVSIFILHTDDFAALLN